MKINKNYQREEYSFANINLLGKCNVNCYFCLGKDIDDILSKQNQLSTHPRDLKSFDKFIALCKEKEIKKIYITGQNCDSLQYRYLATMIYELQGQGFTVGLRTNGYLAMEKMNTIALCKDEIGYSINSLTGPSSLAILNRWDVPRWDKILSETKNSRVSIVVNRHNIDEFFQICKYVSQFPKVQYIQARRISTETRLDQLMPDIQLYEGLYERVRDAFDFVKDFYGAEIYNIYGKEVCFWRTVETKANSINYFTDGTISDQYFIIDGYLQNYKKDDI